MDKFSENNVQMEEESIDINQIIKKLTNKWPWILLSLILCIGLSLLYLKRSTPMYRINARILVNDEKKGAGLAGGEDVLGDLGGILGTKSTVDNEAEILKARSLMEEVVSDMDLNITYYLSGRFRDVELNKSPFKVQLLSTKDTIRRTSVQLALLKNSKLSIIAPGVDTIVAFDKQVTVPDLGTFIISRNRGQLFNADKYSFTVSSIDERVSGLMKDLNVAVSNKLVTIIDLSINYPLSSKGEAILNKLIEKYVQGNINDKNEVADSTIKFIKNRLAYIGGELGDLEGNIQGFKQRNNLADMTEQSKLLVQNTSGFMNELGKVETQISILSSLQAYLKDENGNRVLPSSLLPSDLVFTGLIDKYNGLLLERDRSLLGVTVANPVIKNLDVQISNLRKDMLANLISTKSGLTITREKLRQQMSAADQQIHKVPATERNYLNLARQQQIKQELYIFLMQKSEETAISKTSNIANSKTFDPPKSEVNPFSPKRSIILFVGFLMGMVIPIGIIFGLETLNRNIKTKDDIIKVTNVPILGEISHNLNNDNLVVLNSSRSAIAEQFRAMRTNLSFYLGSSDEKVVLLTSSMSGEGKSFIAINFGNILALTGKKILLMELDLRKPGLSTKLNRPNNVGFTNYIINKELEINDIIQPLEFQENMYLISSGPIPPNPSETILNIRAKELIEKLKLQFDYIIIDAPPIGLVTDAQLLEKYSDLCLYLVRQNFTLKAQVKIVDDLYVNNRMKKIGIVVNDINESESYGYAYGYGYGYGYGSYGNESTKQGVWERIIKKFK